MPISKQWVLSLRVRESASCKRNFQAGTDGKEL